ncbi:MAG: outer membrane lipoprotein carrier protein LolA [Nevskiaceae bacterium]|jgi:outer membrane lipoprotein-sorting protein|nr:outer membrane lipoprotein carrier protein LolA [Nevskiaceae bacterium]
MRKLSWLLLLVAVGAVGAQPSASDLMSRLHEPAVLRGNFLQSRQISGFKRPVESSGQFVVARGTGLLWHTERPFESVLSVSRERLRISNGAGRSEMTLDARREPMLRTINDLLQSVVVADVGALQAQFEIDIRLMGQTDWELSLRPKDAGLRDRFLAIDLSGGPHVETVVLREKSGDVTTVRFSNQAEDSDLSEAEAQQLR